MSVPFSGAGGGLSLFNFLAGALAKSLTFFRRKLGDSCGGGGKFKGKTEHDQDTVLLAVEKLLADFLNGTVFWAAGSGGRRGIAGL